MTKRLSEKKLQNVYDVSLVIPKGDLTTKKTKPESIGVDIERRLLSAEEQRWRTRSGESTRVPLMWPRFESWRQRHMWVEFVVGSLPCSERFFSGCSGFLLYLKTSTSKL